MSFDQPLICGSVFLKAVSCSRGNKCMVQYKLASRLRRCYSFESTSRFERTGMRKRFMIVEITDNWPFDIVEHLLWRKARKLGGFETEVSLKSWGTTHDVRRLVKGEHNAIRDNLTWVLLREILPVKVRGNRWGVCYFSTVRIRSKRMP